MIPKEVWVAIITGACAIIGEWIISNRKEKDLYAKLDKQSELADERMKGEIAVVNTKLTELTKHVEKHNSMVERTYALEKEVAKQGEQIKALSNRPA